MQARPTLLLPGLAVLTGLLSLPVWAGWLDGERGGLTVFLVSTSLLLALSWRLTDQYGDDARWDSRTIDCATIALSVIVVLGLVLGSLGWLYLPVLMLALASIGLAVFVVGEGFISSRVLTARRSGGGGPLPSTKSAPTWSLVDVRWPHALLAGLVMFGIGQLAGDRALLPPVGDAIDYHLSFVAEWMQHGTLLMPVPAAGDPSPPFYPLSSSLWMFWTTAPFGSDVLARFTQVPFFVLLFLSVVRLALEIRIPPGSALAAGLLTISLPDIIRSLSAAENDVILAALLVAATANLALLWRQPTGWRAAMGAALLGLAAGSKVLAVPSVAVLGTVWLAIVVYRWRPRGWQAALKVVVLGAALVLLLGSYSYIRNWIVMDNPSYPVRPEFGGQELFPGLYTATQEWRETHPFYPFDWAGFFGFGMRTFFGWTVALLILPGLLLAVVRAVRERAPVALLLLLWCVMSLAIFWFIIPYHFERFLYATLAWAVVVAIWGWLVLLSRPDWLMAAAVIPLALVNVASLPNNTSIWREPIYLPAAVLIVLGTAVAVLAMRHYRALVTSTRAGLVGVALTLLLIVVWPVYTERYETERFNQWGRLSSFLGSHPESWHWLWEATTDEPATIAVAGTNATFPLYGPTLENRIITISSDGRLQTYDWGSPYRPPGEPDREQWIDAIHEAQSDYVWVTPYVTLGGWPDADSWAEQAGFEPVIIKHDLHVWRVPQ